MTFSPTREDTLCIDTLRTLSIDAVQKANSGHPGLPMGAAPMAYVLWRYFLKYNPNNPKWADRDRFLLSAGHGSMLIYSLLHLAGFKVSLEDIQSFRQWGSCTPGHPESFMTQGVEATTGPLGQGTANAVGMAIAERSLAQRFNQAGHTVIDHFTYALVSDGDLMEGIAAEAASLAGHLKLGKLIYLYDANDISLDGPLEMAFSEDVASRYQACGWHVQTVLDGDQDLAAIYSAIAEAKAVTDAPSLIIIKTTIGFGSPNKAGKAAAHGSPLGNDEIAATKAALGWPYAEPFTVPTEALEFFRKKAAEGIELNAQWDQNFAAFRREMPNLAEAWDRDQGLTLPPNWDTALPNWQAGTEIATRSASGEVLNALAKNIPNLMGGDADLSSSTKTRIKDSGDFDGQTGAGRNIRYGVREHAMGAIANGMAYHGGLRTYTATFFCFADYMRPAMRLAAISHLPVTFVFTHDSIGVGEDGPTHQPVEHLASLRSMPNMDVLRPGDASETREAWRYAMMRTEGPTTLVFTRQNLPEWDRDSVASAAGLHQGGYVLIDASLPLQIILIATGSEVSLTLDAQKLLEAEGIGARVVSLPCWEAFSRQPLSYRHQVLPPHVTARLGVEMGCSFGWERWIGDQGEMLAMDQFGASAPGEVLMEKFGFTTQHVVAKAKALLGC